MKPIHKPDMLEGLPEDRGFYFYFKPVCAVCVSTLYIYWFFFFYSDVWQRHFKLTKHPRTCPHLPAAGWSLAVIGSGQRTVGGVRNVPELRQ